MIDKQADAEYELNRLARGNECPEISLDQQRELLVKFQRGAIWSAATVFQIGQAIIPTAGVRNGHHYRAKMYLTGTTNQQTGATEPTWNTIRDAQITDGSIIWEEDGWDWNGVLWDFDGAAEEAWRIKAMKTVGRADFSMPQGISIKASQLHDHCLAMAKQFHRSACL